MKNKIFLTGILMVLSFTVFAGDTNAPAKPYPLKICLICGMQLGDMGKPFVFEYKGQEFKVCDKSEKSVFDKNPDKYVKKLADEVAKLKK